MLNDLINKKVIKSKFIKDYIKTSATTNNNNLIYKFQNDFHKIIRILKKLMFLIKLKYLKILVQIDF